jgi:hypothetical protein
MVEVKVSLWEISCMDSAMFGFGVCQCSSHWPTREQPLEEMPSLNLLSGEFEGFISSSRYSSLIIIPLEHRINQYGERVVSKAIHVRISNK